jgi:hypothetical protein
MGYKYKDVISINFIKFKAAGLAWTIADVGCSSKLDDAVPNWGRCREMGVSRHPPKSFYSKAFRPITPF